MLHQPKPIVWGKSNEVKAQLGYLRYMEENGHHDIKGDLAGFVVDPYKCWLGASPDVWVTDPSVPDEQGIAEFKCPYSKASVHPYKACEDADFYCSIIDGNMSKKTHSYYHQVQLVVCLMQLFKMMRILISCMFHATIQNDVNFVCIPHVVLLLKGFIWILRGKVIIALNSMITT